MCLSWLSHLYLILGDPEQALAYSRRVPAHVRELEHPGTAAVALAWGCIFHQLLRDPHNAEHRPSGNRTRNGTGLSLYRAVGSVIHGWAQARSGEWLTGLPRCNRDWPITERQARRCGRPTSWLAGRCQQASRSCAGRPWPRGGGLDPDPAHGRQMDRGRTSSASG